jgi:hypothetical protein
MNGKQFPSYNELIEPGNDLENDLIDFLQYPECEKPTIEDIID